MILLGKNPGLVQKNCNVDISEELEGDDFLTTHALKRANIKSLHIPDTPEQPEDISDRDINSASSSCMTFSIQRQESEEDGELYLAGYLARKHREDYPHLGQYTYKAQESNHHNYAIPSWLQNLSFGGLTEPSREWAAQALELEKYFKKRHKINFKSNHNIVKSTTSYLTKKVPDVPEKLVQSFSRQRIFVRINFLNLKRDEAKLRKRSCTKNRKIGKKMKKITT